MSRIRILYDKIIRQKHIPGCPRRGNKANLSKQHIRIKKYNASVCPRNTATKHFQPGPAAFSHKNITFALDAGGTNFVFGAVRANRFVVDPITMPANAADLDRCLATMVEGFNRVIKALDTPPAAISFAFPGPADYPNGIIGGHLPNFPSFRNGVALGPFLHGKFGIPVYINNDADLYAYGEALAGALPDINERLAKAGSSKRYRNLLGYTFGTGFGFGFVSNGELHVGDNSCVETFCLKHKHMPDVMVEDGVAVRAVKRVYAQLSGSNDPSLEPKDIFDIAEGKRAGDSDAARRSFAMMGEVAGDAMATAVTLIDGLIVIGGGITAAAKYIMPSLLAQLRGRMFSLDGGRALEAFLCARVEEAPKRIAIEKAVSLCCIILLMGFGFFVLLQSGGNFTLLLLCGYLIVALFCKCGE